MMPGRCRRLIRRAAAGNFVAPGTAVVVNGNQWLSYADAQAMGFATANATCSNTRTYSPAVDTNTNTMLRTGIWCSNCDVNFTQSNLPNGSYRVYLWTVEDWQSNYRSWNLFLQGEQVASGLGQMPSNEWRRYGPFQASSTKGVLTGRMARVRGDPSVQGIEIWSAGAASPTPSSARKYPAMFTPCVSRDVGTAVTSLSSEQWRGTDKRKEIGGRSDGKEPRRLACSSEIQIGECIRRDFFQGLTLIYPVAQVGKRYRHLIHAALRAFFPDGHQAIGLVVRERAKEHGIDHAEHCGVCADA